MIKTHYDMTDSELYNLCKIWGSEALEARRKFIGLLPEVFKRRLFERRGFSSIYHFAAELGGVGELLVNEVLRLEKRFESMPKLHQALVKGEIGMSKLARIASVVEVGNEAVMCEKIRNLSRRAVDVLVKEMREDMVIEEDSLFRDMRVDGLGLDPGSGAGKTALRGAGKTMSKEDGETELEENGAKSLAGQRRFDTISGVEQGCGISTFVKNSSGESHNYQKSAGQNHDFEILAVLSPEVKAKLKELIDKEIDVNAVLLEALERREHEIDERKAEIGETPAKSRYIPVRIKQILKEEFGRKCSVKNCQKLAEQIHHEKYFSVFRDHDPHDLKPLCRGHHEIIHVR